MADNSEHADFSKEFLPVWLQFKIFYISIFLGWISVIVVSYIFNIAVLLTVCNYIFIAAVIVLFFYSNARLICPKCGFHLFRLARTFIGMGMFDGKFLFGGECPNCNVILKKRLFSEESRIRLKNRLLLILAIVFVLGIIGAFMRGSIKITHQHIELPPSTCK